MVSGSDKASHNDFAPEGSSVGEALDNKFEVSEKTDSHQRDQYLDRITRELVQLLDDRHELTAMNLERKTLEVQVQELKMSKRRVEFELKQSKYGLGSIDKGLERLDRLYERFSQKLREAQAPLSDDQKQELEKQANRLSFIFKGLKDLRAEGADPATVDKLLKYLDKLSLDDSEPKEDAEIDDYYPDDEVEYRIEDGKIAGAWVPATIIKRVENSLGSEYEIRVGTDDGVVEKAVSVHRLRAIDKEEEEVEEDTKEAEDQIEELKGSGLKITSVLIRGEPTGTFEILEEGKGTFSMIRKVVIYKSLGPINTKTSKMNIDDPGTKVSISRSALTCTLKSDLCLTRHQGVFITAEPLLELLTDSLVARPTSFERIYVAERDRRLPNFNMGFDGNREARKLKTISFWRPVHSDDDFVALSDVVVEGDEPPPIERGCPICMVRKEALFLAPIRETLEPALEIREEKGKEMTVWISQSYPGLWVTLDGRKPPETSLFWLHPHKSRYRDNLDDCEIECEPLEGEDEGVTLPPALASRRIEKDLMGIESQLDLTQMSTEAYKYHSSNLSHKVPGEFTEETEKVEANQVRRKGKADDFNLFRLVGKWHKMNMISGMTHSLTSMSYRVETEDCIVITDDLFGHLISDKGKPNIPKPTRVTNDKILSTEQLRRLHKAGLKGEVGIDVHLRQLTCADVAKVFPTKEERVAIGQAIRRRCASERIYVHGETVESGVFIRPPAYYNLNFKRVVKSSAKVTFDIPERHSGSKLKGMVSVPDNEPMGNQTTIFRIVCSRGVVWNSAPMKCGEVKTFEIDVNGEPNVSLFVESRIPPLPTGVRQRPPPQAGVWVSPTLVSKHIVVRHPVVVSASASSKEPLALRVRCTGAFAMNIRPIGTLEGMAPYAVIRVQEGREDGSTIKAEYRVKDPPTKSITHYGDTLWLVTDNAKKDLSVALEIQAMISPDSGYDPRVQTGDKPRPDHLWTLFWETELHIAVGMLLTVFRGRRNTGAFRTKHMINGLRQAIRRTSMMEKLKVIILGQHRGLKILDDGRKWKLSSSVKHQLKVLIGRHLYRLCGNLWEGADEIPGILETTTKTGKGHMFKKEKDVTALGKLQSLLRAKVTKHDNPNEEQETKTRNLLTKRIKELQEEVDELREELETAKNISIEEKAKPMAELNDTDTHAY